MTTSYWRTQARAVIQRTLSATRGEGLDETATRQRLRAAYPFGARAYHPYKIWLSEVRQALAAEPFVTPPALRGAQPAPAVACDDLPLFAVKREES